MSSGRRFSLSHPIDRPFLHRYSPRPASAVFVDGNTGRSIPGVSSRTALTTRGFSSFYRGHRRRSSTVHCPISLSLFLSLDSIAYDRNLDTFGSEMFNGETKVLELSKRNNRLIAFFAGSHRFELLARKRFIIEQELNFYLQDSGREE